MNEAGAVNYVQSGYAKQVAELVMSDPSDACLPVRPVIRIGESTAWTDALRLAIAFLKRHKITQAISTIRTECPEAPKATGYARTAEVDAAFSRILETADDLSEFTFDDHVAAFTEELDAQLSDADQYSPPSQKQPLKKRS
jgi:hypothetical protein